MTYLFKVLLKFLTGPYWSLSGNLLYMHCSHLYRWGGNSQMQWITRSDFVSEAGKAFALTLMCSNQGIGTKPIWLIRDLWGSLMALSKMNIKSEPNWMKRQREQRMAVWMESKYQQQESESSFWSNVHLWWIGLQFRGVRYNGKVDVSWQNSGLIFHKDCVFISHSRWGLPSIQVAL